MGDGGRSEARTAADRNITIYTIGFGDANGDKLRDIANITGGSYTFVEDASDLPEVFARVAENVTSSSDSDGDGIPDRREITGIPASSGLIRTDPTSPDTDDNGLTDREELGDPKSLEELRGTDIGQAFVNTLKEAGYTPENATDRIYVEPNSDPTMVDTDGDDLDDNTETTSEATVARTTSEQATRAVLSSGEPSASKLDGAFDPTTVSSDPWSYDTDGDGLSDGREHTLGTDPTSADTNGDGITDPQELETKNDPTLYDIRRPEVTIRSAFYRVPETSFDTTYNVVVGAEDAAGITRLELRKDGETEASASLNPDANRGETVRRRLAFTDSIEVRDVETDSVESTFRTVIGARADVTSEVSGKFADATLGTTVYARATDGNGNQRQGIAIERSNFYGEVAGDIVTGNDFVDDRVAARFGKVSGFSASAGVLLRDISEFVDDPTALVEGITALYGLVREEGAGVAGTITELLIKEIERKQARNNPYGGLDSKEYPGLYDTYRDNYYAGYSAGFLAKLVVSAGVGKAAKNTIKSIDKVNSIAQDLKKTRAVRALARVDSAKEAAKARTVARILLAGERAVEPVVSQARTAGRAFRVWQIQRQMDADVDTLPESQQSRLGDTLVRSGPDAREAFRRMSQDALSELTALDVDPAVRAQLAPKYAEFGSTKRQQLSSLVDGDSVAASNAGRLETEGVRNALDYACNSPCSIQTDLSSPMWKVDAEVHDSLKTRLSSDQFQRLAESDVGTEALEATDDLDSISTIKRVDGELRIEGESNGIETELTYPDDRREFYVDSSNEYDNIQEIRDESSQALGAGVVEDDIAPQLVERRQDWDVLYAEEKGGTDPGIDLIARKSNDDGGDTIVVTEVKFTRQRKKPGKGLLSSTRTIEGGTEVKQMRDRWVDDAFEEEISQSDLESYDEVEEAIESRSYEKEVIVVQDGRSRGAVTNGLNDFDIDKTTVVRTRGVTK